MKRSSRPTSGHADHRIALADEVAELETDEADRREMLEVARVMRELRTEGDP